MPAGRGTEDTAPLLSVVIVNWNTRDLLTAALTSIAASHAEISLETLVVDNGSSDGSADAVRREFPDIHLIANSSNRGYAEANNQGIRAARGAYILLLNPDVVIPAGALDRAVDFMQQQAGAGALGARLVSPDGMRQDSVRAFPTPRAVFWELIGLSRVFPKSRYFGAYRMRWFGYDRVAEVDQPMGAFLMIRRAALEATGLLDPGFPIFFNEVDWLLRCKQQGWKVFFTPDVQVIHHGGASTRLVGRRLAWESRRGLLRFYAKHYRRPWHWPMRAAVAILSWPYAYIQARRREPEAEWISP